jgi:hypothetical protein
MLRDLADFEHPLRRRITYPNRKTATSRLIGGYHAAYFPDSHVTDWKEWDRKWMDITAKQALHR